MSDLLNHYLDMMSETVLRHGGTIDKFVGDAVVAFWGAPIARDDDGERAVRAAIAMYEAGEEFRRSAGRDIPPIGCTRVGLHWGDAVVGNFGGKGRIQYTALGDGMNTAARLESANKLLHSTILVSARGERAVEARPVPPAGPGGAERPGDAGRGLGAGAGHGCRRCGQRLTELWLRFDGGDTGALAELQELAASGEDAALVDFGVSSCKKPVREVTLSSLRNKRTLRFVCPALLLAERQRGHGRHPRRPLGRPFGEESIRSARGCPTMRGSCCRRATS